MKSRLILASRLAEYFATGVVAAMFTVHLLPLAHL